MPVATAKASLPSVTFELGWDGVPLHGTPDRPVAVDTETSIDNDLDPTAINRLALLGASDGDRTVLVHPKDLARFIEAHADTPWVAHNWAYDHWVILQGLDQSGRADLKDLIWDRVDRGLVGDSMLLDALVRLAEGKGEGGEADKFYLRGLGDVAREFAGITLDKADPYRKRYGEIVGKKFSEVREKGFWAYAAKDPYATARLYPPLRKKALALARRFAHGSGPDGDSRLARWLAHGPLTEQVQVKAAVALAAVERTGMPFDPDAAREDEQRWRPVLDACVKAIDEIRPAFFKRKNGRFERTKKALTPTVHQADLEVALADSALKIKDHLPDFHPPQSQGKKAQLGGEVISKSAADWEPYQQFDPFLGHWIKLADATKRLSFYAVFAPPQRDLFSADGPWTDHRVRSRIDVLKRTGRTSYRDPNLQQMPRDGTFRGIFRAPPGKKLVTADYSFIELRTLAATCEAKFGYSVLADIIRQGVDPHAYTAALINGMSLDQFLALKKSEPKKFKDFRQAAKALNFGIPGGLGDHKLVAYAAANYGVHLSLGEAGAFRRKLITEVYPELNTEDGYLADDTFPALALNTGLSRAEVESDLPGGPACRAWVGRVLSRIAGGGRNKSDGSPYNPDFLEDALAYLEKLGRKAPMDGPLSEKAREKLLKRTGDRLLSTELTMGHAVTLTGRVRARVRYTVAKNGPFQGLAADGIKLALFRLVREGYEVCAIVHDELVTLIDDRGDARNQEAAKYIEAVMNSSMEQVLGGSVPSGTEVHVGDAWSK